jgi:hypothetical protein
MENKMDTLDVIQTLTEVASLSLSVRKMGEALADSQSKLQLATSMIETAIHELGENAFPAENWLREYLSEGLEHLK